MTLKPLAVSLACLCTSLAPALASADYPERPITMVVPFAPGGNLDITARLVAPALGKALKATVVVLNKPGAGGIIGAAQVAKADPDGYTILVTTPNAIAVAPFMASTGYTASDFKSAGMIANTPLLIDVNPSGKYQDIKSLLKAACDDPGKVTVGHSGIGTTNYVALINLQEATGCKFTAISYKGSGPALVDLAGGQIDVVIDQLSSSANLIHGGKLKALAVMTAERVPSLADIPTLAESGVKGIDASTSTGLLVPSATPAEIVRRLNAALQVVARDKTVKTSLEAIGSTAKWSEPGAFSAMIDQESAQAKRLSEAGKLSH
ncbi:lipoprotein [Bordetella ansorpii]|uniref:Lipoprotein n=1 Tax=Bordetella ansorpii TaxID=288768 RepID=A0A157SAQ2_9BORD|nr:tripartite tricarboxylate transporter substrate binding protein [Bordetella ansorpii]SAI67444.1 lipoprotein [Bordetella ansorpii]